MVNIIGKANSFLGNNGNCHAWNYRLISKFSKNSTFSLIYGWENCPELVSESWVIILTETCNFYEKLFLFRFPPICGRGCMGRWQTKQAPLVIIYTLGLVFVLITNRYTKWDNNTSSLISLDQSIGETHVVLVPTPLTFHRHQLTLIELLNFCGKYKVPLKHDL